MADLRTRFETLTIRLLMGLPDRAQRGLIRLLDRRPGAGLGAGPGRRLGGRSVVLDGQELAPELQLMLAGQRLGGTPAVETLPLEQARAELLRQSTMGGGKHPIAALRELKVPGGAGSLRARLYVPSACQGPDPAPTMLYLHGGGWMYGDLETHDAPCRFLAEQAGIQVLSLEYRLAPEHPFPAALEDARAAYAWLAAHPEAVNADPALLAVGGDSAGGALAASTAVWAAEQGLPMALQLLVYPSCDFVERSASRSLFAEGFFLTQVFMDGAEAAYFAPGTDKSGPDASVLRRESFPDGLAPAILVTAGFDPLRDEGEAYADLLAAHGVMVQSQRYRGLIHGFFNIYLGRATRAANTDIAARVRSALR